MFRAVSAPTTREKLLSAAVTLFAEKGYRDATVADVCEHAHANIASVNYHFQSKENLFRHVLREAFRLTNEVYPIDGGLTGDDPAEKRLRAFMSAVIRRSFDPGAAGCFHRILIHEGTREAAPDDVVHAEMAMLQGNHLMEILSLMLGTKSKEILSCVKVNIIALSVFPSVMPRMRDVLFCGRPTSAKLERFIERQFAFALAGIGTLQAASVK